MSAEAEQEHDEPEQLRCGGLGLKLICAVADRCEHETLADGNHWQLIFNIKREKCMQGRR